jgi:hypothetical protein
MPDTITITEITAPDGTAKFVPPGQNAPDTAAMLERDGLIRIDLVDPYHPRVACWALGQGLPGYDALLIPRKAPT